MARIKRYPLSSIAIDELIKDLERLQEGLTVIPHEIAQTATQRAEQYFNNYLSLATPGRQAVINTTTTVEARGKYGATGRLTATGKTEHDDEYGDFNILMAVEFGAGIIAAGTHNPAFNALGFGPGSYNLHGHALDPRGWFYPTGEVDENGKKEWKHTLGTPATMPMYNTILDTHHELKRAASEALKRWLF